MPIRAHLLFLFILLLISSQPGATQETVDLSQNDCGKCHLAKIEVMSNFGGAHASQTGCLDCHPQHPPATGTYQKGCTECHIDHPHFNINNCMHCHSDPHQPLESLRDPLKPARRECISCHEDVGKQTRQNPSRHSKLFCNRCHTSHKEIPGCLECHQPHIGNQANRDCLLCHPAHRPTIIQPAGYIPATFCQSCHKQQARDLSQTLTNHGGMNCVSCHEGRHPATPQCQDCHGLPHAKSLHQEFRSCLECHGDAHNLISGR